MTTRVTPAVAWLAVVLAGVAAALSIKTVWDLSLARASFPTWFVPLFVAGIAGLLALAGFVATRLWLARRSLESAGGRFATGIWILLAASFVCTSAVHRFFPFRPWPTDAPWSLDPILRFNFALTAGGLAVTVGLALIYAAGRRSIALIGLALLCAVLLTPNDACHNPFNAWWIDLLGASPLMFVPNAYAALFGIAALTGVQRRLATAMTVATALSVGLLGLGHITGVVW